MAENPTTFPTQFAIQLCRAAELYYDGDIYALTRTSPQYAAAMINHERLEEFQRFAVMNDFEQSLVAYHGVQLKKEQLEILELVHKHTVPYIKGVVTQGLLDKAKQDSRSSLEAAQLLIDTMDSKNGSTAKLKQLIIEVSK